MSRRYKVVLRRSSRNAVRDSKRLGPLAAYLLTPVALTAYVMAFWRIGADLDWLGSFVIPSGLLSRWQVWLALAVATQAAAHQLNRSIRGERTVAS